MSAGPVEPAGGQDGPPDVRTAVHATIRLLRAVRERLADEDDADLRGRVEALRNALIRLHRHLEDESEGGTP